MENLFSETNLEQQNANMPRTISKVTIKNYRNIAYKEYDLINGKSLLLTGKNGLGKTNVLEAIYWAVTGLLFDGTSKSESQELKPYNSDNDLITSVKLDFNYQVFSFERRLSLKYSKTGKYKGTDTTLLVNGAAEQNHKTAISKLTDYLGLKNVKTNYDTNTLLSNINLFAFLYNTNSLKTMDYKDIRGIVIDIVGEADYKDIINKNSVKYQNLIEPLKLHGLDLEALKKSTYSKIFDKKTGLDIQCEDTKKLINKYEEDSNIVIDKEDLEKAKLELETLEKKMEELKKQKNSNTSDLLEDYNNKIMKKKNAIYERETILRKEHKSKIESMKDNSLEEKLEKQKKSLDSFKRKRIEINEKIVEKREDLSITESSLRNKKGDLSRQQENLEDLKTEKKNLSNSDDKKIYTCPNCKTEFNLYQTKEYQEDLQPKIDLVIQSGKDTYQKITGLKEGIEDLELNIELINSSILKLQKERNQIDINIKALEETIFEIEGKIAREKKSLPVLDLENDQTILNLKKEIDEIGVKKETLLTDNQRHLREIASKIQELDDLKQPLLQKVNLEVIAKADMAKAENQKILLKKLNKQLQEQKDIELLIKELEKEMYESLDKRVKDVFGDNIKFKLWKKTLEGTYDTRLCEIYVKDIENRFVNISKINTGMYPVRAIEIIEKIKDFYKLPKSFILIDEFGTLDSQHGDLIKAFGEQIFATQKGEEKVINTEIF